MQSEFEVIVRPKKPGYWSSCLTEVLSRFFEERNPFGLSFQCSEGIFERGETVVCAGNFKSAVEAAYSLRDAHYDDGFFGYNLDGFRIGLRQAGQEEMHIEMIDCHVT